MCGLLADRTTQEVAASEVAVQESELSQSNRILMFTCRVLDLRVGSSVLVHTHRISLSLQPKPPPPQWESSEFLQRAALRLNRLRSKAAERNRWIVTASHQRCCGTHTVKDAHCEGRTVAPKRTVILRATSGSLRAPAPRPPLEGSLTSQSASKVLKSPPTSGGGGRGGGSALSQTSSVPQLLEPR